MSKKTLTPVGRGTPVLGEKGTKQIAPKKLDSIDHVAIQVQDVMKAVSWYTEKFACTVSYQDATWALLEFGNINLALVVPAQHPAHLGLVSDTAEENGPLQVHRDGTRSAYIEDPSGNMVEILAPFRPAAS